MEADEKAHDDELAYDPLLKPKPDPAKLKKLSFGQDSDEDEVEDEAESSQPTKVVISGAVDVKQEVVVDCKPPIVTESIETSVMEEKPLEPSEDNKAVYSKEERLREIRAKILQLKEQATQGLLNSKTLSERRNGERVEQEAETSHKLSFQKYEDELNMVPKKGSRKRERETLEKLQEFKKKLKEITKTTHDTIKSNGRVQKQEQPDESGLLGDELAYLDKVDGDDWLRHKFEAEDEVTLAKDANTKSDDWYSVEDPRSRVHNRNRHRSDDDRLDRRHKSRSYREDLTTRQEKERRRHNRASNHSK